MNDVDVLVVGAGPAGATAARTLAKGGARVRLLDRARFPRNKPCGGGLTMRVMDRFPYLRPALNRIPTHYVSRLRLEGPGARGVTIESDRPAVLLVRRLEFDDMLARLAVEAGAELIEGAWVSQVSNERDGVVVRTRDGGTHRASFLVAADGVNGIVTRRLGMNPGWSESHLALDIMEETPHALMRYNEPGTLFVSYGHDGSDGYAYVFPKRDHVNVGVGWLLSYFRERADAAPYDIQQRLVAVLNDRGLIDGPSSRPHFTPYLIPVGGPIRETARGRVLVTGDAGGFVNGYTAEGIYYAMVSGELAGRAILTGGAVARRYVRAWRREIGGELRDSVLIRRYLFSDPKRVEGMVWGARAYPEVAQAIVDYAKGTVAYKPLRRRLLLKFPRIAARLVRIALR